jgi:PAS domain S-box-containing protein
MHKSNDQQIHEQFKLLIETIQGYAIFLMDKLGHILTWNLGAEQIKGYKAEEIIGQHFSRFYSEEDIQQVNPEQALRIATQEGYYESMGWRIRRDGSRFWANTVITALRDPQDQLIGFSNVTRDLTVRKRAEDQFRLATEAAPNGIVMVDQKGIILLVNAQIEKMFGYSRDALIGQPVEILVPDRYRGKHPSYRKGFMDDPQSRPMGAGRELYGLRKDGREFPVEIGLNPIETDQGIRILSTIVDITERKRAQEQFRLVVESAPNGIIMVDGRGKILLVNAQIERMFDYNRNEIIGKPIEILVPERFRYKHPEYRIGFMEHPNARPMGIGRDLYGLRKNGSEFPIEIGLNPIETEQDVLVLSTIVDITERKRSEKERDEFLSREQAARAEAEKANRLKDEFLATVSHELRTPLTAILGWTRMLIGGKLDSNMTARALEVIDRNVNAQVQLIDDLLDISRIISGKLNVEMQTIDLLPLIDTVINAVRPAMGAKDIHLNLITDYSAGQVYGDSQRLQQVIWNLLSNAIKFTPYGGRIDIQLARNDKYVEVIVKDGGQGISPDFLPYVFDRFRQADSTITRKHGGLGLGLAIVRNIVELHGGSVNAESEGEGKGSTFKIQLPMLARHSIPALLSPTVAVDNSLLTDSTSLKGIRVLVVEDEQYTRELINVILIQAGAEVMLASSADEALNIFSQWKPDVLVSDIGMPGKNGYEFIRELRSRDQQEGSCIPAIALTAYAKPADRVMALSSGFNMYIAKPIDPSELLETIGVVVKIYP